MLQLKRSSLRWWQKPLADHEGRPVPAELVVLQRNLRPGEQGAWLNSRGTASGTRDLVRDEDGTLKSVRVSLPGFVQVALRDLYQATGLSKGAPDLVLWDERTASMRFIEVKCPHWDRPSNEQLKFLDAAAKSGYSVAIEEWEFESPPIAV